MSDPPSPVLFQLQELYESAPLHEISADIKFNLPEPLDREESASPVLFELNALDFNSNVLNMDDINPKESSFMDIHSEYVPIKLENDTNAKHVPLTVANANDLPVKIEHAKVIPIKVEYGSPAKDMPVKAEYPKDVPIQVKHPKVELDIPATINAENDIPIPIVVQNDLLIPVVNENNIHGPQQFGIFETRLVGAKYCSHTVSAGEVLILRRDLNNTHDTYAVGVYPQGSAEERAGFIPSAISRAISTILDLGVQITGSCPSVNAASTKMVLAFSGSASQAQQSRDVLNDFGLSLSDLASMEGETLLDDQAKFLFDDAVNDQIVDLSTLPYHSSPPAEFLNVTLMNHQLQALEWLMKREQLDFSPDPFDTMPVDFWVRRQKADKVEYFNTITNQVHYKSPLANGGILADDMGLGKTLSLISLILMDQKQKIDYNGKGNQKEFYSTLIVCPLSVLSNWETQLQEHINSQDFTFYIYHGSKKSTNIKFLSGHEVILTSYDVLANEYNSEFLSTLAQIKFRRLILDEGHNIKNFKSVKSKSCCQLIAKNRWFVSGTPIVNKIDDFYSILKFLRFEPFCTRKEFLKLKKHADHAEYFKKLIKCLSLRRTKAAKVNNAPILQLPRCNIYLTKLEFNELQREKYMEIEMLAGQYIQKYLERGEKSESVEYPKNLLVLLCRIRQFCNDPSLVPKDFFENLNNQDLANSDDLRPLIAKMMDAIVIGDECYICLETLSIASVISTPCSHLFCKDCIHEALKAKDCCPVCRGKISKATLITPPKTSVVKPLPNLEGKSPKVVKLIQLLKATPTSIKTVVFSQWTSTLDIIGTYLQEEKITYCEYTGRYNRQKRDEQLKKFKEFDGPSVLLMSLKCGSVGLNIVEASQVILFDPWWNDSIEAQAIDRCHRLGQSKAVSVFRFFMKDSIEDRVLQIQHNKRDLIEGMFSNIAGANSKSSKEQKLKELAYLFNIQ